MSLLVEHLNFSYPSHQVLYDLSFELEYGKVMMLLGPNGTGKSTLFRCILSLNKIEQGCCRIDDMDIRQMSPRQLAQKIAYIPQSHQPYFNYTVFDFVMMGTVSSNSMFLVPGRKQQEMALWALNELDIIHLKDRDYMHLSGGERQLVLIARAIAQKAKILIMDEPCSNLDFGNQIKVMKMVKRLKEKGYAILISTHALDHAYLYSDVIMALKEGKIIAYDSPQKVMNEVILSDLYQVDLSVCSLENDSVRVCTEKMEENG